MLLPPSAAIPAPTPTSTDEKTLLPFAEEELRNGLQLRFFDQTNRYFGDYHRLYIVVEVSVRLTSEFISDSELLAAGLRRFGERLITTRILERMGVPGDQLAVLRAELVAGYQQEVANYLGRADVPMRLLRAELERKASPSNVLRMR